MPGSAVKVISLGLQVIQGLTVYYSQFKSFSEDIAAIFLKIDGLHGVLQVLESPLQKAENQHTEIPTQVRSAVVACESSLQKLNESVEKYARIGVPVNLEDKLRLLTKRTFSPFQRDTLLRLKATLDTLRANLNLAVGILNLCVTYIFLKIC
jgi:hypothetical protein